MRALFTVAGGTGHFHPLVPVARAMASAGHDVAFAWDARLAPQAEAGGFRCFRTRTTSEEERKAVQAEFRGLSPAERLERIVRRGFPVLAAQQMLPDLLALSAEWPPDLVVSENCEFAGRVAAESWGIPHASVKAANHYPYDERFLLVPAMDALRAMAGLPPDPDAAMVYRYLHLLNEPPHFRSETESLPPTAVRLRRGVGDQMGEVTPPAWLAELLPRPTVYATVGTALNKTPGVLEDILLALRDEPVNLILTVGRDRDAAAFGVQPPNVHVERYIPQSLVFGACDLVLSHCGSGTVLAALEHGLPMVNLPLGADQPDNAARCAELGVGVTVGPEERTPEAIRAAVRRVLADPTFRANAGRKQDEIAALPGPEIAVTLLEGLRVA